MKRNVLGIALVIISAMTMAITISFFKDVDWYETIRRVSYAGFIIGSVMIPNYSKPKNKQL
ncbi:hypothetical protein FZW96_06665 [Bacillus sp. BGMRC 2118]|nr:hypothetical protein FZW96_06665 [Bacillus sp. BGMRC 2118]